MKIEDLFYLYNGLTAISQKELPPKVAFLMAENLSSISGKVNSANEVQKKINKKYIDLEKPLTPLISNSIKDGYTEDEYNSEMDELMYQEADVTLKLISKKEFLAILEKKEIDIKPVVIGALKYILTE